LKLLQQQKGNLQSNGDCGSEGQVSVQEQPPGGSWLEAVARVGIMAVLLPVWLVLAPTVSAVIIHRKSSANVGQLQYPVHLSDKESEDSISAAAVQVSVFERASAASRSADAQGAPTAAVTAAHDIKADILQGIGELPWLRVDVSLPGSHTHGRIVVRRPWIDSSGQDVVKFLVEVAMLR
jgi:hypothetical protein